MDEALRQKIERARELLRTVRHAAVATTNADGSPHNSPVFMAFDDELNSYWVSNKEAMHSQNIARTGQVFIVLFDSVGKGGGLYMAAQASEVEGDELAHGLTIFNANMAALGRPSARPETFSGDSSQRLYVARPEHLWVNMSKKDAAGRVIGDGRIEITAEVLR